jgi:hypothetical protein
MVKKKQKRKGKKVKSSVRSDRLIKLALLIAIVLFIIIIYKIFDRVVLSNEKINLSGESYYQYFFGVKEEYSGNMEVVNEENQDIKLILENDKTIYLDSTPIYYQNYTGKVLFATPMELVLPDTGLYKLNGFTNIIEENLKMNIKNINGKSMTPLSNAFLYDGNDLYFFLEETDIIVGETEYTISPLSYVIVNYKQNIEIYDYEKDEYTIIQDDESLANDVLAKNTLRNYTINMSVDSLSSEKREQLLSTNVNILPTYDY